MVIVNLANLASTIKGSPTGYELSENEAFLVAAEPEQIYNEPLRQNDVLETPLSLSERLSITSPTEKYKSTSTQFQTVIYASPTVADDTKDGVDVINDVINKVINDVINRLKVKLADRQAVILNMIAKSPTITIKRMSEMLSVTQRSVARDISVLKNAGIIIRKGKRNDGTWEIMSHKSHPNHD